MSVTGPSCLADLLLRRCDLLARGDLLRSGGGHALLLLVGGVGVVAVLLTTEGAVDGASLAGSESSVVAVRHGEGLSQVSHGANTLTVGDSGVRVNLVRHDDDLSDDDVLSRSNCSGCLVEPSESPTGLPGL